MLTPATTVKDMMQGKRLSEPLEKYAYIVHELGGENSPFNCLNGTMGLLQNFS